MTTGAGIGLDAEEADALEDVDDLMELEAGESQFQNRFSTKR